MNTKNDNQQLIFKINDKDICKITFDKSCVLFRINRDYKNINWHDTNIIDIVYDVLKNQSLKQSSIISKDWTDILVNNINNVSLLLILCNQECIDSVFKNAQIIGISSSCQDFALPQHTNAQEISLRNIKITQDIFNSLIKIKTLKELNFDNYEDLDFSNINDEKTIVINNILSQTITFPGAVQENKDNKYYYDFKHNDIILQINKEDTQLENDNNNIKITNNNKEVLTLNIAKSTSIPPKDNQDTDKSSIFSVRNILAFVCGVIVLCGLIIKTYIPNSNDDDVLISEYNNV